MREQKGLVDGFSPPETISSRGNPLTSVARPMRSVGLSSTEPLINRSDTPQL